VTDLTFTGERLHAGDELFSVDLARHDAAYRIALAHAGAGARVIELGSGAGYGAATLAGGDLDIVAIDRVPPDSASRKSHCRFVRGDLNRIPLAHGSFDLVVSFQVIEHLEDPTIYIDAIADLVQGDGTALVTTPNLLMSDGVNPFHVHEYRAEELEECLRRRFEQVEVQGISASKEVQNYMRERSARIARIMKLDPLGLHKRLPRSWIEWLFASFAILVRSQTQRDSGAPEVSWRDFSAGPADDDCLDLLAICRRPR
jgi:2-polyprenyl-3-methyl-5-hydroxy-6-metoxy-1,4-benzoquinol methylase